MRQALAIGTISLAVLTAPGCFSRSKETDEPLVVRVEAKARGFGPPRVQRAGDWDIAGGPTFREAIRAFGRPDRCRLLFGTNDWSRAEWRSLGAAAVFTTLGGLPEGADACSSPTSVFVVDVRLAGRRWRTAHRLQIGDSATRLRALYPGARHMRAYASAFVRAPGSYWALVRTTEGCLGKCDSPFVEVPRLIARMKSGRVAEFVVPVGAQGE